MSAVPTRFVILCVTCPWPSVLDFRRVQHEDPVRGEGLSLLDPGVLLQSRRQELRGGVDGQQDLHLRL